MVVSSLIVRFVCTGNTGALFTSSTVTLKLLVALKAGTPLSVTTVVNVATLGPWASVGVQVMLRLDHELAIGTRGYELSISEIHHASKKDAPSGTALTLRQTVREAAPELDAAITSQREGDVAGIHELQARSANDLITIRHEAFSRRGFAEGAVRAAGWISTRTGCYDFTDIYAQLQ